MPVRRLTLSLGLLALAACGPVTPSHEAPTRSSALVHRYSFTQGAQDSVGSVHGILKNSAKVSGGKLVLENGEKSSPDAALAYVEFPAPLIPAAGSTSIVFWFTAKEIQAFARVIDFGDKEGTEGTHFIYFTPSNGSQSRAAITGSDVGSKTNIDADALDDGKEHMVAIVVDGTAKKLFYYVDGAAAGEAADLGENTLDKVHAVHSWVGRSAFDADGGLSGAVDELRVYKVALSKEQIKAMAALGPDRLPAD